MHSSACDSATAPVVTMAAITERVGEELIALARAMHHLQGLISPLLIEAAVRSPGHLRELQDFDHIAQKLGNLGGFVAALAGHVPDHWRIDPTAAARAVTLAELSSRLAFDNETANGLDHPPGDFELF